MALENVTLSRLSARERGFAQGRCCGTDQFPGKTLLKQILRQSDDLQLFDVLVKMGWVNFPQSQVSLLQVVMPSCGQEGYRELWISQLGYPKKCSHVSMVSCQRCTCKHLKDSVFLSHFPVTPVTHLGQDKAWTSISLLLLLRTGEEEILRNDREEEKYLHYAVEGFFACLLLFRTFFFFKNY